MKPTYLKSWAKNLLMWFRFDLEPLLQGQTTIARLESADNLLIIKRPARDACLCMGELPAPPAPAAPPAPHFVFLITL